MNFIDLRAALTAAGRDPLAVTCSDYDDAETVSRALSDRWVLWHHDGAWDVGGVERGRFLLDSRHETESDACDRLVQILLVGHPVHHQSADERASSEAITRANGQRARERIAELRRQQP